MDVKLLLLLAVAATLTSKTDGQRQLTEWKPAIYGGEVVGWTRSEKDPQKPGVNILSHNSKLFPDERKLFPSKKGNI